MYSRVVNREIAQLAGSRQSVFFGTPSIPVLIAIEYRTPCTANHIKADFLMFGTPHRGRLTFFR